MNNNEELLRQYIASGKVSASQIEAHRQAGDLSDERSSGVVYAELPERRRVFLCTKCGGRECESGSIHQTHPPCKCGYQGFAENLDFTEDQMRDFADRTHALRMQAATKAAPVNSRAWPKVSGVSRDEGHSRALLVFFAAEPTDDEMRAVHDTLAASPTPPVEQAAPKAEPGVGNSGFDYKTAADFLNGKTVSDEAVRKFVATSRWAHDERAALSATLLAMHGVLTSREAEIALLKKALLEAETAPQPAPAPLSEMPYEKRKAIQEGEQISASDAWFKARHEMLDTLDRRNVFRAGFDRGWNAAIAAQGGK